MNRLKRSHRLSIFAAFLFSTFVLAGCPTGDNQPVADASTAVDGFAPPRDDIVPAVGSATTFDLATWNIEFFPKADRSPQFLTNLIASLQLDLIAVEEIADTAAFDEVMTRLPDHTGVLSSHTYDNGSYQKIGFIYREGTVSLSALELLFEDDTYAFPRPPVKTTVTVQGEGGASLEFIAIAVHLKAGLDPEDAIRRELAIAKLDTYLRELIATGMEDEIVVLGDFNEVVTTELGRQVLAAFLGAPTDYTIESEPWALDGGVSFIPASVMLDHIVTTAGLDAEVGNAVVVVPPLDTLVSRYDADLSDHLPVTLSIPMPR